MPELPNMFILNILVLHKSEVQQSFFQIAKNYQGILTHNMLSLMYFITLFCFCNEYTLKPTSASGIIHAYLWGHVIYFRALNGLSTNFLNYGLWLLPQ